MPTSFASNRASRWALAATLALGCAGPIAQSPEARTARYLRSIRAEPQLQAVFLRQMPKGGELHTHLSGATYAESYMRWAVEDGFCVRRSPPALLEPPCDAAHGTEPADVLDRDEALRHAFVDALSMRNFDVTGVTGHDHFFATFDAFEARRERMGDMLAEVVSRLARQNTWYVEVMQSLGVTSAGELARGVAWESDLARVESHLDVAGIARLVTGARARLDAQEARMRSLLRCGHADEDAGCRVTVRYLVQMMRTAPPEDVFAQTVVATALIEAEPRAVGLNLVAPEDDPLALRGYAEHMRAIGYVTRRGERVNVSLHAGELTPTLVPPEDAGFHIRDAVRVAGARRIGHGTDIAWEDDARGTMREMVRRHVAVEHCLTSADVILGVRGAEHPFALYRSEGVAQVLCTDDEGVGRTDLSREYLRALRTWDLGWQDLKRLARNALEYAFLPGESLLRAGGDAVVEACAGDAPGASQPSATCQSLLTRSDKAREQWRLEGALSRFEALW